MHLRKVAIAACAALSTLALAGCGLPGLGGGTSNTPVSQPTAAPASATPATTSASVASPTESATTAPRLRSPG